MLEFNRGNALAEMPIIRGSAATLYFKQAVYNRWAVEEIFNYIDEHPEWKTLEAIEQFIALMDNYIANAVTNEMRWIFCVARDEADYLRDWCIGEEFHYEDK